MKRTITQLGMMAMLGFAFLSCKKEEGTPITNTTLSGAIVLDCDISNDITLTNHNKTGVEYILNRAVVVSSGKFAIDTNVRIQITPQGSLTINGSAYINAVGLADKPITFEGTSSTAGSWSNISIETNDTRNKMDYCILKNGGSTVNDYVRVGGSSYSSKAMLYVFGRLSLTNSTLSNSEGQGVWFASESVATSLKSNVFSQNKSFPIAVYAGNMANCDFASCTFTDNSKNNIAIYGVTSNSEIAEAVTIKKAPVAYYVMSELNFLNNTEFNAGTNFIMSSSSLIRIYYDGYLKINGTALEPVNIVGESNMAGFWDGIHIKSNSVKNEFTYLNISDGGNEPTTISSVKANISVADIAHAGYLKLSNVTSTNFSGCALAADDTEATVVNNSTLTIEVSCTY
jgi:hypothetical protein